MANVLMTRVSLNKSIATILATLLTLTAFAVMPVSAENSVSSDRAWGVSYDWSEYGEDVYTLTGLNIDEILAKFTEAAETAGFEMLIAQLSTGQSMIFIEQSVGEEQTVDDLSGTAHQVTEHITDLTIVNAIMFDMIMMMEWEDPDAGDDDEKLTQKGAGIDITMQFDAEFLLSINSNYVEYRTTGGNEIVGADVTTTMDAAIEFGMSHESHWTGGDDVIDINLAVSNALGASITDSTAEWRLSEPYDVHDSIDLSVTDVFDWDCSNYYDEFSVSDDEEMEYAGEGVFEPTGEVNSRTIETPCGSLTGNYASAMNYDFSLSGVPADLLGLDAEVFNIAISDQPTYTGTFEHDDMEFNSPYMFNQDKTYNIVIDDAGTQVEAMSFLGSPIPVPHAVMNAAILMHAFEGSEDDPGLANVIEEEMEDIAAEFEPEVVGTCDEGYTELTLNDYNDGWEDCGDGTDEPFEHKYFCEYSWYEIDHSMVNDGVEDCDYGTDESSTDMSLEFECHDGETIMLYEVNDQQHDCGDHSDEVGFDAGHYFTCTNQASMIDVNLVNDGDEDCSDGSDESEEITPTDELMNVIEHLADSNIESTLETFAEDLADRMTDGSLEPIDFPFTDADGDLLWYDGAPIGFLTFVEENDEDYIFIGPETEGYDYAPSSLGFEYLVGEAVADAVEEVGEIDDISDVIEEGEHDTSALDGVGDLTIDEAQALATTDTDGDGVSNLNDQCPTTPSDTPVGNDGCIVVVEDTTTDTTDTTDTTTDTTDTMPSEESAVQKAEDEGMIPSVSFIATLGILALAGFATSRRD